MATTLVRIVAPRFVAGVVLLHADVFATYDPQRVQQALLHARVIEAAPIVRRWAMGRTADVLLRECRRRGYAVQLIDPTQ